MTEEQLGKLFEAFYAGRGIHHETVWWHGPGASRSARRFCRMMAGDLTVKSEYGKGSTFTVKLPLQARDPKEVPPLPSQSEETDPAENSSALKILVIDDDANVRDLMQRHLTKEGFQVSVANDGKEGIGTGPRTHARCHHSRCHDARHGRVVCYQQTEIQSCYR